MKKQFITLEENDVLRLGVKTKDGIETGQYLEFDLEDIELPLRYQELIEKDKKNRQWIKNQLLIIDKRQDVKGQKLMSKNEEDKIKAMNEFFKKEIEIYNMFLGENGIQKLLNGRKFGWTSLRNIDKIIEEQILPYIDIDINKIADKIERTYNIGSKEKNVMKSENIDKEISEIVNE